MDIGALEQDEEFVAKVRDLKTAYLADKEREYIEQTYKFSYLIKMKLIQGLAAGGSTGLLVAALGSWTNIIANKTGLPEVFFWESVVCFIIFIFCTGLIKKAKDND